MKFTLGKKILAGFIVCSLILIVLAWTSFKNSEKLLASNQWVVHTHEVLYTFEQILAVSIAAETSERGYIITGDETYLGPLHEAKAHVAELIDRIKELTLDNLDQRAYPQQMEGQVNNLLSYLDKCILVRKTEGFAKAQQLVAIGTGENLLNEIRETTNNA